MNLTDLRDELDLHVRDLEADTSAISAGIAGKVRSTKRRRTAGAVGGLCAAVVAAGLVLTNQPGRPFIPAPAVTSPTVTLGADGTPERTIPDSPGDVVKDGLRFRAKVGDDRLAVGFIGDEGQGQFTLMWEPSTQHVSIASECYVPGADTAEAQALTLRVSLEGTEGHFGSMCQAGLPQGRDLPASGITPGEPGEGWPELAIGSGARLRVQLVGTKSGKPTSFEGVRIVAAVYDLGAQRLITDDAGKALAAIPEVVEHQGYRYFLEGFVSGPLAKGPLPEITTPDGRPFLVAWGSADTGTPGNSDGSLQLTGLDEESSGIQGGGWSTAAQRARTLGTAAIRVEGPRPTQGTAFIATYVPAG